MHHDTDGEAHERVGFVARVGRLLLSGMFLVGGWDAATAPERKVPRVADSEFPIPSPEQATRVNGITMVVGGAALALGIRPRLAALVLAGSLVPTTVVGHPFWRAEGGDAVAQRIQFVKNLGLLGGLLGVIASDR